MEGIFVLTRTFFRPCTSSLRCRKTNSRYALKHVFRRTLRCGGMVPGNCSTAPSMKMLCICPGNG